MNCPEPWNDDVFREKSLFDVYKESKEIERNVLNVCVMRYSFLALSIYVCANAWTGVDNNQLLSSISRLSASMITVTTAILGFLIAGFSIFISSTPRIILIKLLATRYKETNISFFKQIMFNFLNVFSVYLIVMCMSLSINTATPLGWSPVVLIQVPIRFILVFNSVILSLLILMAIYSALRLKSFIWTMYQGLIINIMLDD